jgi:cytochrome c oxidase assembly protein subunit 11
MDGTRNKRVAFILLGASVGMLGLGYAAVPLYDLFCRTTGFGGTTQRATLVQAANAAELAKSAGAPTISIRFDTNTSPDLPWSFRAQQITDTVQIGQRDMALFEARNDGAVPVTGTATFNVEPEQAGAYFNKIQCFCFTEQTLRPGQQVTMPVLYYVDPKALDDPNMKGVEQITLSYTFHLAKDQPNTLDQPQSPL